MSYPNFLNKMSQEKHKEDVSTPHTEQVSKDISVIGIEPPGTNSNHRSFVFQSEPYTVMNRYTVSWHAFVDRQLSNHTCPSFVIQSKTFLLTSLYVHSGKLPRPPKLLAAQENTFTLPFSASRRGLWTPRQELATFFFYRGFKRSRILFGNNNTSNIFAFTHWGATVIRRYPAYLPWSWACRVHFPQLSSHTLIPTPSFGNREAQSPLLFGRRTPYQHSLFRIFLHINRMSLKASLPALCYLIFRRLTGLTHFPFDRFAVVYYRIPAAVSRSSSSRLGQICRWQHLIIASTWYLRLISNMREHFPFRICKEQPEIDIISEVWRVFFRFQ